MSVRPPRTSATPRRRPARHGIHLGCRDARSAAGSTPGPRARSECQRRATSGCERSHPTRALRPYSGVDRVRRGPARHRGPAPPGRRAGSAARRRHPAEGRGRTAPSSGRTPLPGADDAVHVGPQVAAGCDLEGLTDVEHQRARHRGGLDPAAVLGAHLQARAGRPGAPARASRSPCALRRPGRWCRRRGPAGGAG